VARQRVGLVEAIHERADGIPVPELLDPCSVAAAEEHFTARASLMPELTRSIIITIYGRITLDSTPYEVDRAFEGSTRGALIGSGE